MAKEAIGRLMWSLELHLITLAETGKDPSYTNKLAQIRGILLGEEEL